MGGGIALRRGDSTGVIQPTGSTEMAEPLVINALSKKRAELAGEIKKAQQHLQKSMRDLEHLDQTLLLFDCSIEISKIKPRTLAPPDWAKRGEMTRTILELFRKTSSPLTIRDIAQHVVEERELNADDAKLMRAMKNRVGTALRALRHTGRVSSRLNAGSSQTWCLAETLTHRDCASEA